MSNVVFFCSMYLEKLPLALEYYENQICVEQRLKAVENKLSEVQSIKNKLSDLSKTLNLNLMDIYHKEIHNEISTAIF